MEHDDDFGVIERSSASETSSSSPIKPGPLQYRKAVPSPTLYFYGRHGFLLYEMPCAISTVDTRRFSSRSELTSDRVVVVNARDDAEIKFSSRSFLANDSASLSGKAVTG